MSTLGPRFARAVGSKDVDAVRAILAPDVDFRALTPGRAWEGTTADDVVGALFDRWFGPSDDITAVLDITCGAPVADTERVSYRLALHNDAGAHVAEQQVYYRVDGDVIVHLRILCSGFRPVPAAP